jgi:hypothetical protein
MRPAATDRALVIGIAAAAIVWTACLVVLWARPLDASVTTQLLVVASALLAICAAVRLPGRIARATQRVLTFLKLQDVRIMELTTAGMTPSGRREARATLRLLGVSSLLLAVGGLGSVAAVLAAPWLIAAFQARMLWTTRTWAGVQLAIAFVGMLPVALGLTVAFLAGTIVRAGSGRDVYASLCRDWFWAAGGGFALFGLWWWAGGNILGLAAVTGLALAAMGAAAFLRRQLTRRPRKLVRPVEAPSRRLRWGVRVGYAALALALAIQGRLLSDAWGAALAGQSVHLAATMALLALFLGRADRRSRLPSATQAVGCAIGVLAGLFVQGALVTASVGGGALAMVCTALAAGAQIPLAAMAAIIFSRQRQAFARAGGRPRAYAAAASGGLALGTLVYLLLVCTGGGRTAFAALGLVALAAVVVRAVLNVSRPKVQLKWVVACVVLLAAAAACVVEAVQVATASVGRMRTGAWLTSAVSDEDGREVHFLPGRAPWRSPQLTRAVRNIVSRKANRGRWWIVGGGGGDLGNPLPNEVHPTRAYLDLAAAPEPPRREARPSDADRCFLSGLRVRRSAPPYDGIYLSALPADHPQAWRCYNEQTLRRCAARVHTGRPILLRIQARPAALGSALAVAKTFYRVVPTGRAIIAYGGGNLDMLLVGPGGRVSAADVPAGCVIVPLARFWKRWPTVRPIRILHPVGPVRGRVGPDEFWRWLETFRGQ